LIADHAHTLWIATLGTGLWRSLDGEAWERVPLPQDEPNVHEVAPDPVEGLWIGIGKTWDTRPAVYRWHQGGWMLVPQPAKRGGLSPAALAVDGAGQLWVGTHGDGVWRWDGQDWQRFGWTTSVVRPGLPGGWISGLCVDTNQCVWAATHNGVARYDGTTWRWTVVAPEPPSLEGVLALWRYPPESLHLDQHGRLWFGGPYASVAWIDTTGVILDDPLAYTLVEHQPQLVAVGEPPS
jgi:ligand-binding sensor domain-containing protein